MLIPKKRTGYSRVTHPFATLTKKCKHPLDPVRLACVKHAASVHPEPGSNSPTKTKNNPPKTAGKKNDPTKKPDQKWFKPENNPAKTNTNNQKTKRSKIISIKKTKTRKNQTHPKNKASPVQSHTNKTKKHTIENTNNQTTNQPKTISKGYCAKKRASLSLTDLIFGFQLISK